MKHLLIDADILAYKSCVQTEDREVWDNVIRIYSDLDAIKEQVLNNLGHIQETLGCTDYTLCLTDDHYNFRRGIDKTYKSNRYTLVKPVHLSHIKAWMLVEHPSRLMEGLEADDVMGIMATGEYRDTSIIVSEDKDLQQIPGLLFNPDKDTEPREITPEEGYRFHMLQTLMGDRVDGYYGCKGIGPVKGNRIIDEAMELAGEFDVRENFWLWDAVVDAYLDAGMSEPDALRQARLAKILQAIDYDFDRQEPLLWIP